MSEAEARRACTLNIHQKKSDEELEAEDDCVKGDLIEKRAVNRKVGT